MSASNHTESRSGTGELRVDVVVVGAGLSGLTCAYRLSERGFSVVAVEARDRVGGRTLNAVLDNGERVELGGQWIGPGQPTIRAMAEELGVGTFPTYLDGDNLVSVAGRMTRYRGEMPRRAPLALLDFAQAARRVERMSRRLDLHDPASGAGARRWDTMTPETWIRRNMITPSGLNLMRFVIEATLGVDAADISMLHFVLHVASAGSSMSALVATRGGAQQDRFVGGSQELSLRLAERLGERVHLQSPVRAIVQEPDGVVVHTDLRTVRGQYVVVAVPPVLTATIDFTPPLPADRMQLAQRMAPGAVIKYMAVYPEPFWRADGLTGHVTRPDGGPVKVTFDNSPPDGRPGVLLAFALARDARRLARVPDTDRRAAVLSDLAQFFGERARTPDQLIEHSWADDPWTRGGYAGYFQTGGWTDFGHALRPPLGRVHWAGSETAVEWPGSMTGAIQAGDRAAAEVAARLESQAKQGARGVAGG